MYCTECGTKNDESAQFCINCGKKEGIDFPNMEKKIFTSFWKEEK